VQLHQNRVQCFFVLCGRDVKILAACVFSHIVHDSSLLEERDVQIWRSVVPYPENWRARRAQPPF
jgi:hypothetical protein